MIRGASLCSPRLQVINGDLTPFGGTGKPLVAKSGVLATLRFSFAFFGVNKRYRDLSITTVRAISCCFPGGKLHWSGGDPKEALCSMGINLKP
jgi:hypothetical protein